MRNFTKSSIMLLLMCALVSGVSGDKEQSETLEDKPAYMIDPDKQVIGSSSTTVQIPFVNTDIPYSKRRRHLTGLKQSNKTRTMNNLSDIYNVDYHSNNSSMCLNYICANGDPNFVNDQTNETLNKLTRVNKMLESLAIRKDDHDRNILKFIESLKTYYAENDTSALHNGELFLHTLGILLAPQRSNGRPLNPRLDESIIRQRTKSSKNATDALEIVLNELTEIITKEEPVNSTTTRRYKLEGKLKRLLDNFKVRNTVGSVHSISHLLDFISKVAFTNHPKGGGNSTEEEGLHEVNGPLPDEPRLESITTASNLSLRLKNHKEADVIEKQTEKIERVENQTDGGLDVVLSLLEVIDSVTDKTDINQSLNYLENLLEGVTNHEEELYPYSNIRLVLREIITSMPNDTNLGRHMGVKTRYQNPSEEDGSSMNPTHRTLQDSMYDNGTTYPMELNELKFARDLNELFSGMKIQPEKMDISTVLAELHHMIETHDQIKQNATGDRPNENRNSLNEFLFLERFSKLVLLIPKDDINASKIIPYYLKLFEEKNNTHFLEAFHGNIESISTHSYDLSTPKDEVNIQNSSKTNERFGSITTAEASGQLNHISQSTTNSSFTNTTIGLDDLYVTGGTSSGGTTLNTSMDLVDIWLFLGRFYSQSANETLYNNTEIEKDLTELGKLLAKSQKVNNSRVDALNVDRIVEELRQIYTHTSTSFLQENTNQPPITFGNDGDLNIDRQTPPAEMLPALDEYPIETETELYAPITVTSAPQSNTSRGPEQNYNNNSSVEYHSTRSTLDNTTPGKSTDLSDVWRALEIIFQQTVINETRINITQIERNLSEVGKLLTRTDEEERSRNHSDAFNIKRLLGKISQLESQTKQRALKPDSVTTSIYVVSPSLPSGTSPSTTTLEGKGDLTLMHTSSEADDYLSEAESNVFQSITAIEKPTQTQTPTPYFTLNSTAGYETTGREPFNWTASGSSMNLIDMWQAHGEFQSVLDEETNINITELSRSLSKLEDILTRSNNDENAHNNVINILEELLQIESHTIQKVAKPSFEKSHFEATSTFFSRTDASPPTTTLKMSEDFADMQTPLTEVNMSSILDALTASDSFTLTETSTQQSNTSQASSKGFAAESFVGYVSEESSRKTLSERPNSENSTNFINIWQSLKEFRPTLGKGNRFNITENEEGLMELGKLLARINEEEHSRYNSDLIDVINQLDNILKVETKAMETVTTPISVPSTAYASYTPPSLTVTNRTEVNSVVMTSPGEDLLQGVLDVMEAWLETNLSGIETLHHHDVIQYIEEGIAKLGKVDQISQETFDALLTNLLMLENEVLLTPSTGDGEKNHTNVPLIYSGIQTTTAERLTNPSIETTVRQSDVDMHSTRWTFQDVLGHIESTWGNNAGETQLEQLLLSNSTQNESKKIPMQTSTLGMTSLHMAFDNLSTRPSSNLTIRPSPSDLRMQNTNLDVDQPAHVIEFIVNGSRTEVYPEEQQQPDVGLVTLELLSEEEYRGEISTISIEKQIGGIYSESNYGMDKEGSKGTTTQEVFHLLATPHSSLKGSIQPRTQLSKLHRPITDSITYSPYLIRQDNKEYTLLTNKGSGMTVNDSSRIENKTDELEFLQNLQKILPKTMEIAASKNESSSEKLLLYINDHISELNQHQIQLDDGLKVMMNYWKELLGNVSRYAQHTEEPFAHLSNSGFFNNEASKIVRPLASTETSKTNSEQYQSQHALEQRELFTKVNDIIIEKQTGEVVPSTSTHNQQLTLKHQTQESASPTSMVITNASSTLPTQTPAETIQETFRGILDKLQNNSMYEHDIDALIESLADLSERTSHVVLIPHNINTTTFAESSIPRPTEETKIIATGKGHITETSIPQMTTETAIFVTGKEHPAKTSILLEPTIYFTGEEYIAETSIPKPTEETAISNTGEEYHVITSVPQPTEETSISATGEEYLVITSIPQPSEETAISTTGEEYLANTSVPQPTEENSISFTGEGYLVETNISQLAKETAIAATGETFLTDEITTERSKTSTAGSASLAPPTDIYGTGIASTPTQLRVTNQSYKSEPSTSFNLTATTEKENLVDVIEVVENKTPSSRREQKVNDVFVLNVAETNEEVPNEWWSFLETAMKDHLAEEHEAYSETATELGVTESVTAQEKEFTSIAKGRAENHRLDVTAQQTSRYVSDEQGQTLTPHPSNANVATELRGELSSYQEPINATLTKTAMKDNTSFDLLDFIWKTGNISLKPLQIDPSMEEKFAQIYSKKLSSEEVINIINQLFLNDLEDTFTEPTLTSPSVIGSNGESKQLKTTSEDAFVFTEDYHSNLAQNSVKPSVSALTTSGGSLDQREYVTSSSASVTNSSISNDTENNHIGNSFEATASDSRFLIDDFMEIIKASSEQFNEDDEVEQILNLSPKTFESDLQRFQYRKFIEDIADISRAKKISANAEGNILEELFMPNGPTVLTSTIRSNSIESANVIDNGNVSSTFEYQIFDELSSVKPLIGTDLESTDPPHNGITTFNVTALNGTQAQPNSVEEMIEFSAESIKNLQRSLHRITVADKLNMSSDQLLRFESFLLKHDINNLLISDEILKNEVHLKSMIVNISKAIDGLTELIQALIREYPQKESLSYGWPADGAMWIPEVARTGEAGTVSDTAANRNEANEVFTHSVEITESLKKSTNYSKETLNLTLDSLGKSSNDVTQPVNVQHEVSEAMPLRQYEELRNWRLGIHHKGYDKAFDQINGTTINDTRPATAGSYETVTTGSTFPDVVQYQTSLPFEGSGLSLRTSEPDVHASVTSYPYNTTLGTGLREVVNKFNDEWRKIEVELETLAVRKNGDPTEHDHWANASEDRLAVAEGTSESPENSNVVPQGDSLAGTFDQWIKSYSTSNKKTTPHDLSSLSLKEAVGGHVETNEISSEENVTSYPYNTTLGTGLREVVNKFNDEWRKIEVELETLAVRKNGDPTDHDQWANATNRLAVAEGTSESPENNNVVPLDDNLAGSFDQWIKSYSTSNKKTTPHDLSSLSLKEAVGGHVETNEISSETMTLSESDQLLQTKAYFGSRGNSQKSTIPQQTASSLIETTTTRSTIPSETPAVVSWSDWLSWGKCSVTCGVGQKIRRRRCEMVIEGFLIPTDSCPGSSEEVAVCENGSCLDEETSRPKAITAPSWSEWSNWGQCSVSCGPGVRSRRRVCRHSDPSNTCPGDEAQAEQCFGDLGISCPKIPESSIEVANPAIYGLGQEESRVPKIPEHHPSKSRLTAGTISSIVAGCLLLLLMALACGVAHSSRLIGKVKRRASRNDFI